MKSRSTMVMLVGLAALYLYYRYTTRKHHTATPAEVPALQAGDEGGLALDAETVRTGTQLRVRLRVKGAPGELALVLRDPEAADERGVALGRAVLEPQSRAAGTAFVDAIALWLQQPAPPPTQPNELGPWPLGYVRLESERGWVTHRLLLERGDRTAEVVLRLSSDGRQARLLEQDENDRTDLLALLALALRDGAPPPRAPDNDPLVATMDPLFHGFAPLAGAERLRTIVGAAAGLLAAREIDRGGKRASELLRWTDPREAPRVVATLDGVVAELLADPSGAHAGLGIVYPKEAVGLSSDDPGAFAVADLAAGTIRKLPSGAGAGFAFGDPAAFSPAGAHVAVVNHRATGVFDVASGDLLGLTPAALDLVPLRWDADGLVLVRIARARPGSHAEPPITQYHWRYGVAKPRPVSRPALRSPDGRYAIDATADGITITGPGGVQRLRPSRPGDRDAFRALRDRESPHWLGPAQVMLTLEEAMVLDLPSGKLHYLFPLQGLRWAACSRDGRVLVARDRDERYVWAQR
jgi:hypothetical protein